MIPKNLIIFILLAILILGAIFIWLPKYQDFDVLRFKVKEREIELRHKKEYFSDLFQTSQKLKEYSAELAKIDSALPTEPSILDLLRFLEKESAQNGLILTDFNFGDITPVKEDRPLGTPPLEAPPLGAPPLGFPPLGEIFPRQVEAQEERIQLQEVSIKCSLSGSYPGFKNFLSALQKSARLFEVESISFSSAQEKEEKKEKEAEEMLDFDLEIKAYSY